MSGPPPPSWIRLWCDFLSNWKVASLPEPFQLRLVKLWLIHAQGHLVGASVERLAWELRLPVSEVQATLEALTQAGLVEADGTPHGWERRQPRGDHSAAERQRRRRSRQMAGDQADEDREANTSREALRNASRNASRTCHAQKERKKEREERLAHSADGIPFGEIVTYLNERTGSAYRATTKKTRELIGARWAEGFRLDDFRAVIDGRVTAWAKKPDMREYLRPETLFGTKFESYLQAASRPGSGLAADDLPNVDDLMRAAGVTP